VGEVGEEGETEDGDPGEAQEMFEIGSKSGIEVGEMLSLLSPLDNRGGEPAPQH